MFTQRLSMDCTQEQYEKYLKEELEKIGYEESIMTDWSNCSALVNNLGDNNGKMSNVWAVDVSAKGRTYLGKFNAPLFLALAAMTDKEYGGYGEWWVKTNGGYNFIEGEFYKTIGFYNDGGPMFIDKNGTKNGLVKWCFNSQIRKATASEIMAKFGEQPQRGTIEFEIALDTTGLSEQIDKLKNTLVAKEEEQMISLLKSKGYKIFKQTTTLEEV